MSTSNSNPLVNLQTDFFDANGNISRPWIALFQSIGNAQDISDTLTWAIFGDEGGGQLGNPLTPPGKVGIGVRAPVAEVEIANNGAFATNLYLSGMGPAMYLGNAQGVAPNGGAGQQVEFLVGLATAAGQFAINKGDAIIATSSLQAGNGNAIKFGVPNGDTGNITIVMTILRNGDVGIGTVNPTSPLQVVGIPTYASDSAAGSGGLTSGAFYKDSGGGLHVKL